MNNKRKDGITIAFVFLLFIVIGIILTGVFRTVESDSTLQGDIEFTNVRISSKLPGRIEKYFVQEGDYVELGDTLATISTPEIDAKLKQVESAMKAAEAINNKVLNGSDKEQIKSAYELWIKAKAALEVAQKSYERIQNLHLKSVVSTQKRDESEANFKAMKANEEIAKAQYDLIKKGANKEDKKISFAQLERAKATVAEVLSYIEEATLTAPISGKVGTIFPQRGELVGTGAPIMNIIDTSEVFVLFSIREEDYHKFSIGESLYGYIPALNNEKITMKITSAKNLGNYAIWKATKQTGELDSKTFEIRAIPQTNTRKLIEGMTVIINH